MKLGIVTYQIGKDWDVPAIIKNCSEAGISGVELRATHAHGVEVSLSAEERREVKARFADGGIEIAGLGSAFEFHSDNPEEVRKNIDGTIEYTRLAADLGCPGVKVRPNGLQEDKGIPPEKTLEQIGRAVNTCAQAAADFGVEVRVEVHGKNTKIPANMKVIMDWADHPNAGVCWNSNAEDRAVDGSISESFELLEDRIKLVHIIELANPDYPWRDLFTRLKAQRYEGYTLAEIGGSADPVRLLKYYRALWLELTR
jgi:sugar phosphate isomerase/epimerase